MDISKKGSPFHSCEYDKQYVRCDFPARFGNMRIFIKSDDIENGFFLKLKGNVTLKSEDNLDKYISDISDEDENFIVVLCQMGGWSGCYEWWSHCAPKVC